MKLRVAFAKRRYKDKAYQTPLVVTSYRGEKGVARNRTILSLAKLPAYIVGSSRFSVGFFTFLSGCQVTHGQPCKCSQPPLPSPRGRGEATAWVQGHEGKEHGRQALARRFVPLHHQGGSPTPRQGTTRQKQKGFAIPHLYVPLYLCCRLPPGGTEGG